MNDPEERKDGEDGQEDQQQQEEEEAVASFEDIVRIWQEENVMAIEFVPILEPPYVIYGEKTLAISMKILKPLYLFAYQKFFTEYKMYQEAKSHHSLTDEITTAVFNTSLVILTIKADFPMGYNLHKEILLMQSKQVAYGREIQRLHALFTRHPKSPSAWQHIRWCYLQRHLLRIEQHQQSPISQEIMLLPNELESEREICRLSAEKYPKNYYAWMHRHWLLPQMNLVQLEDELYFSHEWLYMHVSDHSAMQHFVQVINRVISVFSIALEEEISLPEQDESHRTIEWLEEISEELTKRILREKEMLLQSVGGSESSMGLTSVITPKSSLSSALHVDRKEEIILAAFLQTVFDWHVILLCKRCEAETLWLGWKMLIRMVQSSVKDTSNLEREFLFAMVIDREKDRVSLMQQYDSLMKEIFHPSKAQMLWTSFVSFLDSSC